jgi:hypothetical protein
MWLKQLLRLLYNIPLSAISISDVLLAGYVEEIAVFIDPN